MDFLWECGWCISGRRERLKNFTLLDYSNKKMVALVFSKKHLYFMIGILVLMTTVLLVKAYNNPPTWTRPPSQFGHSVDEIDWSQPIHANIQLGGGSPTYKMTNVITPTASSDVATKGYVDAQVVGSGGVLIIVERGSSTFEPTCPSGWIAVETGYWNCGVGSAGEAGGGCFCGRASEHNFQRVGGTESSRYTSHESGTFYYKCTFCAK